MKEIIVLSDKDVESLVSLTDCIQIVKQAFIRHKVWKYCSTLGKKKSPRWVSYIVHAAPF
ncbi:hypothetical protein SRRS_34250 [Sporomusa rhizae]